MDIHRWPDSWPFCKTSLSERTNQKIPSFSVRCCTTRNRNDAASLGQWLLTLRIRVVPSNLGDKLSKDAWICRLYHPPKRREPLAQHSHMPWQTNRLTASNIAVGEQSNRNSNKYSNQPNALTVRHVTTHNSAWWRVKMSDSAFIRSPYCLQ